jgi:pimeloyl-ACP methyl ester carboxylesterase
MIWLRNQTYVGANKRQSLFDVCFKSSKVALPVVIFAHGYKGFKDWGCWDLVAESFAEQGFLFVKFNFSHNGGTIDEPLDFIDLEAFANNCYSYELFDMAAMINMVSGMKDINGQLINNKHLNIIGHSRGGGIVLLYGAQSTQINAISTWAAVSDFESRFGTNLEQWKSKGVFFVENGRTKQQMPHYYSFYEDFLKNKSVLSIPNALKKIKQPSLILHGENDQVVLPKEAHYISKNIVNSKLFMIQEANHTFGSSHPWNNDFLPTQLNEVVQSTIQYFLKSN